PGQRPLRCVGERGPPRPRPGRDGDGNHHLAGRDDGAHRDGDVDTRPPHGAAQLRRNGGSAMTGSPNGNGSVPAKQVSTRGRALRRFAMSITAFNIVGHLLLGFEQSPLTPIVTVLVSYVTALLFERLDSWAHRRSPEYAGGAGEMVTFLLAPHITAL